MNKIRGHFIKGEEVFDNGDVIKVFNPSNNAEISSITCAKKSSLEKAIASSEKAFKEWRQYSIAKRTEVLFEYKDLLEKNKEKLAKIIGEDLGKVYDDALGEVRRGIENVEYACGIGEVIKGEYNKNISTEVDSWSEFVPLGTVLGITPFNFPAMVPMWMFPLALATGNSFILKPSEKDPLGSMFITELFNKTKAPKGLLNLVNGDKKTVEALISDKRIKAVSFVGSTPLQKRFMNYPQFQAKGVKH